MLHPPGCAKPSLHLQLSEQGKTNIQKIKVPTRKNESIGSFPSFFFLLHNPCAKNFHPAGVGTFCLVTRHLVQANSRPPWEQGHREGTQSPLQHWWVTLWSLSEHGVIEDTAGEAFSQAAHLGLRGAGAGPCSLQSKNPLELGAGRVAWAEGELRVQTGAFREGLTQNV